MYKKSNHAQEVEAGERFRFGNNWHQFLRTLNEERIENACASLTEHLRENALRGKSFLDIGSGSGLFSLAAARLGAHRIHSVDYDPQSVECTKELKKRYFPNKEDWIIQEGSALDTAYLSRISPADVVYSWGVLHHTGDLWKALENMVPLTRKGGRLFIAIYNDQGMQSRFWKQVKKIYCGSRLGQALMVTLFFPIFFGGLLAVDVLKRRNPIKRYSEYKKNRGMSIIHDWVDWLGGYPFEVAKPEEIILFYRERDMTLKAKKLVGSKMGCNEFIFVKD